MRDAGTRRDLRAPILVHAPVDSARPAASRDLRRKGPDVVPGAHLVCRCSPSPSTGACERRNVPTMKSGRQLLDDRPRSPTVGARPCSRITEAAGVALVSLTSSSLRCRVLHVHDSRTVTPASPGPRTPERAARTREASARLERHPRPDDPLRAGGLLHLAQESLGEGAMGVAGCRISPGDGSSKDPQSDDADRVGFEMVYDCPQPTPMIFNVTVHSTRAARCRHGRSTRRDPPVPVTGFVTAHGNGARASWRRRDSRCVSSMRS